MRLTEPSFAAGRSDEEAFGANPGEMSFFAYHFAELWMATFHLIVRARASP